MSVKQNNPVSRLDSYLNKNLPSILVGLKQKLIDYYNHVTDPLVQEQANEIRLPQDWKKTTPTPTPTPTSPINNYISPSPTPTPTQGRQVPGGRILSSEIIPTKPSAVNNYLSPTPTPKPIPTQIPTATPTPMPTQIPTPSITNDYLNPQPSINSTTQPQGIMSRRITPRMDLIEAKKRGIENWWEPTVDKYTKKLTDSEATDLIKKYFEPSEVAKALDIMKLESGKQVYNLGPELGGMGLFQFMPTENKRKALKNYFGEDIYENGKIYDAETNVKAAAALLYGDLRNPPQGSGWQHFETATTYHKDWIDNGVKQFPQRKREVK